MYYFQILPLPALPWLRPGWRFSCNISPQLSTWCLSSMSESQQYCLKWNNYQTSLSSSFKDLLNNESFVDCTLSCGQPGGQTINAHRVVLSACSPYFRQVRVRGRRETRWLIWECWGAGELVHLATPGHHPQGHPVQGIIGHCRVHLPRRGQHRPGVSPWIPPCCREPQDKGTNWG